jgi:tetratricopeptide (TPR) repeat protein
VVMSNEGEYESAIMHFKKALSIDPNFTFAFGNLLSTQMIVAYSTGDYEKWIELWGEKVKGHWNHEGRIAVLNAFHEKGHIAGIEEMFKMNEKYGNEGCLLADFIKTERYIKLGEYDKAMDNVEKGVDEREMNMAYIATNQYYSYLKDNPRYKELLKKMNLNQ